MGDYLRYAMFDKYFMKIGAQGKTPGTGNDAAHYLMSWYYAWGGALDANWSWRIGSSHNHFGYQSPMAAWILSTDSDMIPKSPNAKSDWAKSLDRQIEFYQWLQSSEGAIAGGATNSYGGSYEKYPAGTSTFYGMAYDAHPVYEDPGSNQWFGMQGWSMHRMAENYYETGDSRVKNLLDKWATWAQSEVQLYDDGTFAVPSTLEWSGQPDTWTGKATGNSNLHVKVLNYGTDLGTAASLANTLTYYAAATEKYSPDQDFESYVETAQELLDRMWNLYRDEEGVAAPEIRADYKRFFEQEVYIPSNFKGTMPSGDDIVPGVTFIELRSQYKDDPDFARLEKAYKNGEDFEITYHRFWAQTEIAIANGTMALLYPEGVKEAAPAPQVSITTPADGAVIEMNDTTKDITVKANASIDEGSITKVEFYANGEKFAESTNGNFEATYVPTKENVKADGTKEVTLVAVAYSDKNVKKESEEVTITVKFPGIELPVVSITAPEEGTIIDATQGSQSIVVTAEASVKEGEIAQTIIYADGKEIGTSNGASCTATYTTPEGYGPSPEGIVDVVFTAKTVTTEGISAEAEAVNVQVKLPVQVIVVPDVNVNVAFNNKGGVSTNTIGGQVVVTTTDEVDLSKLAIRYYYTVEGNGAQTAYKDNAGFSLNRAPWYVNLTSNLSVNVVQVDGNNYYYEITFNSNEVLDASGKIEMGIRVAKNDWSNYDQSNDYSYNSGAVVLYDGEVVNGTMPY